MLNTWLYNTVLCVERLDKTSSKVSCDEYVNLITLTAGRSGEKTEYFQASGNLRASTQLVLLYFKSHEETFLKRCQRQGGLKPSDSSYCPNCQCKLEESKRCGVRG